MIRLGEVLLDPFRSCAPSFMSSGTYPRLVLTTGSMPLCCSSGPAAIVTPRAPSVPRPIAWAHTHAPGDEARPDLQRPILQTAIKSVAISCVAAGLLAVFYCWTHGIRSADDWRNFRAMRSYNAPIVVALASGSLSAGSSTGQMLAVDTPAWAETYGRCVFYGFAPEGSYDRVTVATLDGVVVSAHAGSCTWHWTFFDQMPTEISRSVNSINSLRTTIDRLPAYRHLLQPLLEAELTKLAVQPAPPGLGWHRAGNAHSSLPE